MNCAWSVYWSLACHQHTRPAAGFCADCFGLRHPSVFFLQLNAAAAIFNAIKFRVLDRD
jgi:hypothetical protein